jgi:hypothetical protein
VSLTGALAGCVLAAKELRPERPKPPELSYSGGMMVDSMIALVSYPAAGKVEHHEATW